jgi:tetratricopeptide (TPR) repeat protein
MDPVAWEERHARFQAASHLLSGAQRPDLAEPRLRELLAQDPQDARAHYLLAVCLDALGRAAEGEAEAERALACDPNWAAAHVLQARFQMDRGGYGPSEQSVLRALALDPEEADAWFAYAQLMIKTGHQRKAVQLLEKCLRLDAEHAGAHQMLAAVRAQNGSVERAREHGDRGLALEPERPFSHLAAALVDYQAGHPFRARRRLREALRLAPDDANARELYLRVDRHCRWISLPIYYVSLAVERLPGKWLALWGAFVVFATLVQLDVVSGGWTLYVLLGYVTLIVYSWIAGPLTSLWIRIFPPR